jgi:sensor histidine kinase YesM/ligand-binding sensor domain-containing protein
LIKQVNHKLLTNTIAEIPLAKGNMLALTFRVLAVIGSIFAQPVNGQQIGQFIENSQQVQVPFTITNYNTKHGLPQNQISDIDAKLNGELILATANGIVSYDGYSFSNFILNSDYKKYFHTRIIYNEKYKKLYGLELGGGFSQINPSYKKLNEFRSACQYKDKIYGVLPDGTICLFDPKNNSTTTLIKTGIAEAGPIRFNGNKFIVGGRSDVYLIDPKSKDTTRIKGLKIERIKENPFNGDIYLLGSTKAYKLLKGNKVLRLIPEMNTSDFIFHDMTFTPGDEVYIGTSKGLIHITPGHSEVYDETTFLPSENIRSLCYSVTENCIFAGTTNKGLLKLQLKNCASLLKFTDLSNASASSIVITSFGKTLVSASDAVVYSISANEATQYIKLPSQPASMSEINGELWIGTWGKGIYRYKGQQLLGQLTRPQLSDPTVHSIFKDSRGTIWVGTTVGVSAGKSYKTIKHVLKKEIPHQIITIYEKKNGHLLLGGSNGLDEVDENNKRIRHWGEKEGLICKEVRAVYEDKFNKIWIGTYDGGLYCLEKGKITSINSMKNCMLNEDIFTLAKDFSGNIYMSSNNGLWVVNEEQLNNFYYRKTQYLIPFIYANEAGIMNSEFNGGFQNNYAHSEQDHFYFPGIEGVVIVSPEKFVFRKLVPQIRWIRVNSRPISPKQTVFERTTHTIEFNFHVANFSSKFNVYYQYQLEGPNTSKHWEQMRKNGNVRISFLPPGDYTLRVRALDAYNDPDPQIVTYHFTIKPYYYETWWFRSLVIVVALTAITLIIRNRISGRRKKEIHENTINNNILELKLKAIQSKMNPHFIFNTLNNIQYLIVLGRKEAAENALTEFSLLLRKFLQQSDRSFVRLNEEMDIIEKYLLFEQISFDGELEILVDIPESCRNRVIPTLLLQPVVENAVKHGLAHSKNKKKISVYATCSEKEVLSISVEDNGIGRESSKGINSSRDNHVSHGWKLIEEKIDMIRQKYGVKITYEITDKSTPETGTVITFHIPLIEKEFLNY